MEYFTTNHPKVVSILSTVFIVVGRIASHPGIAACVGGPILVAVQAVGTIAVAIGEWLRDELDSAGAIVPV